jgi:hypothetical protein
MLESIPIIGGMFDDSEDKMMAEIAKKKALYDQIGLPNVDWQNITPEEYRQLEMFNPEAAQYETIQEDPRLLQSQRDYLKKLSGLSEEGLSDEDKLGFAVASRNASADAQSRRGAALQSARARGVGGGGMEAALTEIGSQQAADRQSMEGMQQAAEAAKRRALYTQAMGGELSNQREQGLNTEARNKDIINRFNQLNSGIRNEANMYNLQGRQGAADRNVESRNQAAWQNQAGRLGQVQAGYQNRLGLADRKAGIYDQTGDFYGAKGEENRRKRAALGSAAGGAIGAAFGGPAGYSVGSGIGGGIGGM